MATGTPSDQDWLNPEYHAADVFDKMNPKLVWHKFAPMINSQNMDISYETDNYSDSTDALKRLPAPHTAGGEIAHVKVSDVTKKYKSLSGRAIGYELSEEVQMFPNTGIDTAERYRERVAYWMAEYFNHLVLYDITDGARDNFDGATADATIKAMLTRETDAGYNDNLGFIQIDHDNTTYGWDDAAADPVGDIIEWKRVMTDQEPTTGERYGYELTDLYATTDAYYALYQYLYNIDANWQRSPTGEGDVIALHGVNVHKLPGAWYDTSGTKLTGRILGVDKAAMPFSIYWANNPAYPMANANGMVKDGNGGDFSLNYHTYTKDENRSRMYDFWAFEAAVVKKPKAMMWINGAV